SRPRGVPVPNQRSRACVVIRDAQAQFAWGRSKCESVQPDVRQGVALDRSDESVAKLRIRLERVDASAGADQNRQPNRDQTDVGAEVEGDITRPNELLADPRDLPIQLTDIEG